MMKKLMLAIALCAAAMQPMTGVAKNDKKDPVLMTVDGREVRRSEFEYFYNKNMQDSVETHDLDHYLELFVNYKLKVAEAYRQGVDTTQAYKDELAGYRAQLAEPYMQVAGWTDTLMAQLKENRRYEVHAAHILVQCDKEATQAQIDSCEQVILDYKRQVEGGVSFDSLARAKSEDPSARQNAGDLGYFSPLQMVYSFEDAAFSTPVGGLAVVRSSFGWHLLKVIDKRESQGERVVAHIMKMYNERMQPGSRELAKTQIDSLYAALQGGAQWEELCLQSDDQYTAGKGGSYGWMSSAARFPKEWLDAAFGLEQAGQYTAPFATDFGWHIVRVNDIRKEHVMEPAEEQKLREQFAKDPERQQAGRRRYVAMVRQQLQADKKLRKQAATWTDQQVLDWADSQLEAQYPEFRNIYREYHDGLMLFDVSSKAVWDKATQDTVGLQRYFEQHRSDYRFEHPRFKGAFIECADDEALYNALKNIYDAESDIDRAADMVRNTVMTDTLLTPNPRQPRFHIVNGLFSRGDNAYIDVNRLQVEGATFTPKSTMPHTMSYGQVLNEPSQLQDVRNAVVADYQAELEKAWVEVLRQRYVVKYNQKEIDKLR